MKGITTNKIAAVIAAFSLCLIAFSGIFVHGGEVGLPGGEDAAIVAAGASEEEAPAEAVESVSEESPLSEMSKPAEEESSSAESLESAEEESTAPSGSSANGIIETLLHAQGYLMNSTMSDTPEKLEDNDYDLDSERTYPDLDDFEWSYVKHLQIESFGTTQAWELRAEKFTAMEYSIAAYPSGSYDPESLYLQALDFLAGVYGTPSRIVGFGDEPYSVSSVGELRDFLSNEDPRSIFATWENIEGNVGTTFNLNLSGIQEEMELSLSYVPTTTGERP